MPPENEEQRKYARLSIHCEIQFAITSSGVLKKSEYTSTHAKDLSSEGVSFESIKKIDLGERLVLKLKFYSKPPAIRLMAEVVRCITLRNPNGPGERYMIGVKFLHPTEKLIPIFLKFIQPYSNLGRRKTESTSS